MRIHRAQRVVQHEDRRVLRQRPGDGGALLLSAGQVDPPLAQHRVVPAREFRNRRSELRHLRDALEAAVVRRAQQDVVPQRVAEEERFLRHDAEGAPQLGQREPVDRDAVDEHATRAGSYARDSSSATVDLPAPVAPTMASERPAATWKETSGQGQAAVVRGRIAEPDMLEPDASRPGGRGKRRGCSGDGSPASPA